MSLLVCFARCNHITPRTASQGSVAMHVPCETTALPTQVRENPTGCFETLIYARTDCATKHTQYSCRIVCVCVSSLRKGHANVPCIVPNLSNDLGRASAAQQHTHTYDARQANDKDTTEGPSRLTLCDTLNTAAILSDESTHKSTARREGRSCAHNLERRGRCASAADQCLCTRCMSR